MTAFVRRVYKIKSVLKYDPMESVLVQHPQVTELYLLAT